MDNSRTRELQLLQTFALQLNVGLWSGNKRKMEIAESHSQPLITVCQIPGYIISKLTDFPRCSDGPAITDAGLLSPHPIREMMIEH